MIPRLVAIVVLASAALAAEPQPLTRAIERANRALPPGPVIESVAMRVWEDGTPAPPMCFYRAPAGQSIATQTRHHGGPLGTQTTSKPHRLSALRVGRVRHR